MYKAILLVATVLLVTGCASSYPLLEFQAIEIEQERPDTLEEFYKKVSEKAGEDQIRQVEGENTVAIAVSGLDALERTERTLKSICETQTGRYADARTGNSLKVSLAQPDGVLKQLPVDFGPTWKQHHTWLEEKLPGMFFGTFDASVQGVCLTKKQDGIEFAYSSVLLLDNKDDPSSKEMMLLITPEEHYAEAIARSKNEPTLRLYRAIELGDVQSAMAAIEDGAEVGPSLPEVNLQRPLLLALVDNDLEMAQLILDAGATANRFHFIETNWIESNLLNGNIHAETLKFIMGDERLHELSGKLIDALAEEAQKTDEDRRRELEESLSMINEVWYLKEGTQVCRPIDGVTAKGVVIESNAGDIRVRVTQIINRPDRVLKIDPDSPFLSTDRWRQGDLWEPC